MRRKVLILIAVASVIRCFIAATTELGNDEVYYWTYALDLQWNYFDHPPGVAVLIRLSTINLLLNNELFIRLGAIICAASNTWLIFLTAKKIKNEKAGYYAALLFTASVYCSLIAGTFILPDSPQLFFWLLSLNTAVDVFNTHEITDRKRKKMIVFGLVAGIAILCKIHAIFLWVGLGMYILFLNRNWLKESAFYLALLLTTLCLFPIFIWNMDNNFITYTYHSNRVNQLGSYINWNSLLTELTGEILYNNPVNFFICLAALAALFFGKNFLTRQKALLLLFFSLPLITVVIFISLFRDTLPHWTGPAYTGMLLIAAAWMAEKKYALRLLLAANGLLLTAIISGWWLINFYPGTLGNKTKEKFGDGDFTLDMYGWKNFARQFMTFYKSDQQQGNTKPGAFIISDKWFPASHIDHYLAYPNHINFLCVGELNDIHNYYWLNNQRKQLYKGCDAYFITTSNNYHSPSPQLISQFTTVDQPEIIIQTRSGIPVRYFYVYGLKGYRFKN
ncbi:MAG: glycosyltransferase family 39 protein [Sphingobacteriales bacterium]|nr:MAG: glycosyltransferase family 39 protein [Sphingobacteriales bacterium]